MALIHPSSRLFDQWGRDFEVSLIHEKTTMKVLEAVATDETAPVEVILEPATVNTEIYKIGYVWGSGGYDGPGRSRDIEYFYLCPETIVHQDVLSSSGEHVGVDYRFPVNPIALQLTSYMGSLRHIQVVSATLMRKKDRKLIRVNPPKYSNILMNMVTLRVGPMDSEESVESEAPKF